jgi:hypothetical protein
MQDIQVGYTLNKALKTNSIRIYISGQNLFTISSYKGMDPDLSGGSWGLFDRGVDWGDYPTPRTILIGMRISFK